jgi:hypothetical protein
MPVLKKENEIFDWEKTIRTKDFITFPDEINKKCTKDEFHKMMTSHNSDIPIDTVNFLDYSNTSKVV